MRYLIVAASAIFVMGTPIASAQTAKPAATAPKPAVAAVSSTCASLAAAYDNVSKDLASNVADSIGDNSAPRATMRAIEDGNSLATAKLAADLMRDNKCPMPKAVPDAVTYLTPALTCATDRLRSSAGKSPESCDRSKWKPLGVQ